MVSILCRSAGQSGNKKSAFKIKWRATERGDTNRRPRAGNRRSWMGRARSASASALSRAITLRSMGMPNKSMSSGSANSFLRPFDCLPSIIKDNNLLVNYNRRFSTCSECAASPAWCKFPVGLCAVAAGASPIRATPVASRSRLQLADSPRIRMARYTAKYHPRHAGYCGAYLVYHTPVLTQ